VKWVQGSGLRVQGSGFRVQGSRSKAESRESGGHRAWVGRLDKVLDRTIVFFNIISKFAARFGSMRNRKIILFPTALLLIAVAGIFLVYRFLYGPNIDVAQGKMILYIPEGASYGQVMDSIDSRMEISHPGMFRWVAEKKKYPALVKPGRYEITTGMSYIGLIDLLRSGRQSPVNVTFNNIRTLAELAGKVGSQIEADSTEIIYFLSDESNFSEDGFSGETVISVFIPNTYQFFWNTGAKDFYLRMLKEYRDFWNDDRKAKAKVLGMTPVEVSTLASIVDEEAARSDEKPRIAGVYINRLRRGIPLQADPTIIYALGDFSIKRVLKAHLETDSPYNTYKNRGLPPGPINSPSISGIESVLNAEKHDYLYFSAKADLSGYHNFSRTLAEHNRYAAEYHRELNRRRIFR
jgi:UPF0755 protein